MDKVGRDYKSFSSAAKSRFRGMSKELGYEQITGILYTKRREGWYEAFSLQASSRGNPFFYLNYGVIVPEEFPAIRENLMDAGWRRLLRLRFEDQGAFPCATKAEIEESAQFALIEYKKVACPWFERLNIDAIERGQF
jgi:Domain of unknown function (DUF4304)